MKDFIKGVLEIKSEHDGVWKGCAPGKNVKGRFSSSDGRSCYLPLVGDTHRRNFSPRLSLGDNQQLLVVL